MKRVLACIALLFCFSGLYAQATNDTFEVYFPLRESKLIKQAAAYIDSLVFKDVLIHGQRFTLLGYADYIGSNPLNDALSQQRAMSVQAYLAGMGFNKQDITLCIGKGKINRTPVAGSHGYSPDRKVQIIIDRQAPPVVVTKPPPAVKDVATAKVNEIVTLHDLLFEGGNDKFLKVSIAALNELAATLTDHKTMRVRIEGHVCCLGEPTGEDTPYYETYLSTARAKAVYDFLVSKGIAKDRLSYKGLGNAFPLIYPERTEEDQAKNRRVDVRVLGR